MIKRAVIFAGGKGKRLRPYTYIIPKPLMPIGEKPILELIINQLIKCGIKHITITVMNNYDIFKSLIPKNKFKNTKIDFVIEKKPMGTSGALKIIKNLPEEFLAMNGDIITDINFRKLYNFHKKKKSDLTMCVKTISSKIEYGAVEIDKKNLLKSFKEKPIIKTNINLGIYIMKKKLIKNIRSSKIFGFDKLIKEISNKKVSVFKSDCRWFDIGREKDLFEAKNFLLKKKN